MCDLSLFWIDVIGYLNLDYLPTLIQFFFARGLSLLLSLHITLCHLVDQGGESALGYFEDGKSCCEGGARLSRHSDRLSRAGFVSIRTGNGSHFAATPYQLVWSMLDPVLRQIRTRNTDHFSNA